MDHVSIVNTRWATQSGQNSDGFFFNINTKGEAFDIHACRESFSSDFKIETKIVGFSSPKLDIDKLRVRWRNLEDRMNLRCVCRFLPIVSQDPATPSLKGKVIPTMVAVELYEFWSHDAASRAVFTLMLRYLAVYYKSNFWKDMDSYSLLEYDLTKECLRAYFGGKIHWTREADWSPSNFIESIEQEIPFDDAGNECTDNIAALVPKLFTKPKTNKWML